MLPGSLPLPKGASLAEVSMHHAAAAAASATPPSLIDVRHMYARACGAPAFAPIAKVPSLMELNARASSPGGVKVPPVKSLEEARDGEARRAVPRDDGGALAGTAPGPGPTVAPIAARALDAARLVREAEAHRAATQAVALTTASVAPAPQAGVTCANCRTQKTPLWRNGPLGPKTLCNACGVRFKLGKLPPPGGWPPGHVPPPPPPRKRAAHGASGSGKASGALSTRPDDLRARHAGPGAMGPLSKKQRRKPRLAPSDEYVRNRFGAGASALTEHDGAVLLMVLAGLYDH